MNKWVSVFGAGMIAVGVLSGGCTSSSDIQRRVAEQKRTYLLEADTAAVAVQPVRFGEVKIRTFRSLPPFNSPGLVVKRANGETVLDFYTAWIAAPHELVRVQAARYLEKAGLFRAVHDTASGTLPSLGLEGTVCELFLDCRGEKPEAVVTLRLVVLDERTPGFTVLCTAEETARAEYDPAREDGIAQAFNSALTQVLGALARELGSGDNAKK